MKLRDVFPVTWSLARWLIVGTWIATALIAWSGYRATQEWRRSSELLVQRRAGFLRRTQTLALPAGERGNEAVSLFPERGVAADAILMFLRCSGRHVEQLSHDAGPHRQTVTALFPVVELSDVASSAGAGGERGFERAEMNWRSPLRLQGPAPVFLQEAFV